MERMIMKAATTVTTDQGVFTAVISTETIDREKDIVSADGMVAALHKWNRPIPLSWNHGLKAEDIFGHIDPQSARNTGGEVEVTGQVDLSSATGGEAWRSFKNRTVGFSFGYLVPQGGSAKRAGGGRNITALDIFEVTATPAPMNNDTRVLSTKATTTDAPPTSAQARILNSMIGQAQEYIASRPDSEDAGEMRDVLDTLHELVGEPGSEDPEDDAKALKAAWDTAYVNNLPDSAFLYVAAGGSKDSDGKTTPRSLRYFPVRDASGAVDQAHVRNALARIPQANLPQSVKDTATTKARRLLDSSKAVDATDEEPPRARSVDPLRRKADALALEVLSGGESLRKPPRHKSSPPAAPRLSVAELRRQMHQATLDALIGGSQQ